MVEYEVRRFKMVAHLGGKCVKCETSVDLQFDHVDSKTKSFDVSKNWSRSWEILAEELNKCQLLCKDHHLQKSRENKELGGGQNKWIEIRHGAVWAYNRYKCRCDECKLAKSLDYQKRKVSGN